MNILITGASGLIGSALKQHLNDQGHQVFAMRRDDPDAPFYWQETQPHRWMIKWDENCHIDAVIHLAGESLGVVRWSAEKKRRIRDSRIDTTKALVEKMAQLPQPPSVFLSASAIGFYGNCGQSVVDEVSPAGNDFLAQLAIDWEAAANTALDHGIRVVNLRTGLVLAKQGGALAGMLPAFKMGMGGRLGNGQQMMSWVSLAEITQMITYLLDNASASGPFNLVSQHAVNNSEFAQTLASTINRPAIVPMPAFMVKTLFGEMGDLLLLSSAHVKPAKLSTLGFPFADVDLRPTLSQLL